MCVTVCGRVYDRVCDRVCVYDRVYGRLCVCLCVCVRVAQLLGFPEDFIAKGSLRRYFVRASDASSDSK